MSQDEREAICKRCQHYSSGLNSCLLYRTTKQAKVWLDNQSKSGLVDLNLKDWLQELDSVACLASPRFRPHKKCNFHLEHFMESKA